MKYSRLLSISSAVFTAFTISIAAASARNPEKYANVPFVVPGYCPQDDSAVSSSFVSTNGKTVLRVVANEFGNSGFVIYASVPGSNRGDYSNVFVTPPQLTPFPQGILTFMQSGFPAGGFIDYFVEYSDSSGNGGLATISRA